MPQSPIDKAKTDSPFSSDPSSSFTMPARYYTDSTVYEKERDAIFFSNWWYVGHSSQLATRGEYITASIDNQNVFVVADEDGELRGFYNVCQHRGHELLAGAGQTNMIRCPYHAWAYDLNGSLQSARNTRNVPGFNKCEFSLKTVRVEKFCGMVFVNLNNEAEPLALLAAELEKEIRDYCPDVDSLKYAQRDTYNVECNWKVMIDNFLECYHCHPAHKDFVDLVDMESYRSVSKGIYSSHISKAVNNQNNNAFSFEKGDVDFGYAGWYLWPNLTIWAYPGEANLSILQMNPNGAGNTLEFQDWFVRDGKPSKQLMEAMAYQKDVLQPEDITLCESVQRGLQSRGYNQGRFVVDTDRTELSEHAVHHFQEMVVNALGADLS